MRKIQGFICGVVLAGCAGQPVTQKGVAAPPQVVPATEVENPNFILTVSEIVSNPNDDGVSYTKVIVDGQEIGKTPIGPRSAPRTLKLRLPLGNLPVRLEQWTLPGLGEWTRAPEAQQPRERFVRIEEGTVARLDLRFAAGEDSHTLALSREPNKR